MSDDFGTVNVTRGDRAREIEVQRQRYRAQRDALLVMAAEAPTEQLAAEYQRLSREIDVALRKLDDLGPRSTSPGDRPLIPGERPLIMDPHEDPTLVADSLEPPAGNGSRVAVILVIGILVVTAIVWLIWRGSERGQAAGPIVEQSTVAPLDTAATATTATAAPAPSTLKVKPLLADYGTIRKGTRGVRQFEVTNAGTTPVSIQVARSECRCLFYEYRQKVAPNAKETVTIAVDGAKAKAGPLHEVIAVTAKEDPSIRTELTVQATIK
jgi:hypothetical protein